MNSAHDFWRKASALVLALAGVLVLPLMAGAGEENGQRGDNLAYDARLRIRCHAVHDGREERVLRRSVDDSRGGMLPGVAALINGQKQRITSFRRLSMRARNRDRAS
jgi:hypothetical protein